jgi:hypothetical protein
MSPATFAAEKSNSPKLAEALAYKRDLGRGWTTPRGFRAALACCGARGSRCLCWTDGPSAAKVYSAQIGSSRETRFVAKSQNSVITLKAVPPSTFQASRTARLANTSDTKATGSSLRSRRPDDGRECAGLPGRIARSPGRTT